MLRSASRFCIVAALCLVLVGCGSNDAQHLKVLTPNGSLIETLGQKGQGPGEFQRLSSLQISGGDSIYADDGRLWVQRPAEGANPDTLPWWVLDPDTKTIHEITVPADVNLEVVRNGNVYGTTTTERDTPILVRYHIDTNA